jgi:hypothetical protein
MTLALLHVEFIEGHADGIGYSAALDDNPGMATSMNRGLALVRTAASCATISAADRSSRRADEHYPGVSTPATTV